MNDFKFESQDPIVVKPSAQEALLDDIESIQFLVPVRIKLVNGGSVEATIDYVNRKVYLAGKPASEALDQQVFDHLHKVTTKVDNYEAPLEVYDKAEEAHSACLETQQKEADVE